MGTFAGLLARAQLAAPTATHARLCAVPSWLAVVGRRYIVAPKTKRPDRSQGVVSYIQQSTRPVIRLSSPKL